MPKYTFLCHRTIHYWGHIIDVEAQTEEEAREKAEKWFDPIAAEGEIVDESQELESVDGVPAGPVYCHKCSWPVASGNPRYMHEGNAYCSTSCIAAERYDAQRDENPKPAFQVIDPEK